MSNGAIFISYRRKDSAAYAQSIYERLAQRYDAERVFMDVSIPPGTDFVHVIRDAIRSSGVVLVIIGPDWLRPRGEGRALEDYVVFEVETALEHGKLVIPV